MIRLKPKPKPKPKPKLVPVLRVPMCQRAVSSLLLSRRHGVSLL